jgi:hypothetical protein
MFNRRKAREEGREIGARASAFLDECEARSWEWRQAVEREGEEAANAQFAQMSVTSQVAALMDICRNNQEVVIEVISNWADSRMEQYEEDRAGHVWGMVMALQVKGIGNLFGAIPEESPAYDAILASDGRALGWRR